MSWQTIGGLVLVFALLLNTVLLTVLVSQMSQAQKNVDLVQSQFNEIFPPVKAVVDVFGRVLHGSIPNLVDDLITIDFVNFGRNVSSLASAVVQSFDYSNDPSLLQVSQYSALVGSVADKFTALRPNYAPAPVTTDDQGVLNVLSYLIEWTTTQVDPLAWQRLGKQCVAVVTALLNTDWSGSYYWNHRTQSGSWDANSAKSTANIVFQYCTFVAGINPQEFLNTVHQIREAARGRTAHGSATRRPVRN